MCFLNFYDFFLYEIQKLVYSFETLSLKPMKGDGSFVLGHACTFAIQVIHRARISAQEGHNNITIVIVPDPKWYRNKTPY